MAQTSYIDLTPEQEDLFFKTLQSSDRFQYPRISRKLTLFSVKRKAGLVARSLLPQIAELWNGFSEEEKQAWKNVVGGQVKSGYNLFVQDQTIRIKNDIAGVATPNPFHQSWVGYLSIEEPATEIKIAQYHPRAYWVSNPVKGKKGMREPVEVIEDFALPLKIQLSYKSNLMSQGEGSFAKFYAVVRSSYQGQDIFTNNEISLDFSSDWKSAEKTLTNVQGYVIGYTLYFHLFNLRGTLYFDNIKAEHSGQNWVRDPFCKNVNEGFTKAFFQIPMHWVAVELPNGATFESFYPT
jgi:hypothetical protein